jgi:hypothetical protein
MKFFLLSVLGCQHKAAQIRPWLEKFVADQPSGTFTVEGIIAKFYTGEWSCWIVTDDPENGEVKAVAATFGFLDMKGDSNVKIVFIVGTDKNEWWDLFEQWVELCRETGVRRIEIVGRRGLARTLKGFDNEYVVLTRELKPMQPNVDIVGRA